MSIALADVRVRHRVCERRGQRLCERTFALSATVFLAT